MSYKYVESQLHELSDSEKEAYIDFTLKSHEVYFHKELKPSREHIYREISNPPSKNRFRHDVAVWENDKIIGMGTLRYNQNETETNSSLCDIFIQVLPAYTRKGIGSKLMRQVIEIAEAHDKDKMEIWVNSYSLDGMTMKLVENIGLKKAIEEKCNRLLRSNINQKLLQEELPKLSEKLKEFNLKQFSRSEYLNRIINDEQFRTELADFYTEVMALIPKEDSERSIEVYSANDFLNRAESWLKDPYNGYYTTLWDEDKLIGISVTSFPEGDLRGVDTGLTGVRKKYQRKGIAMYLKLLMIKHYLEFDEFQYIDTENPRSNIGMIKINEDIGFQHIYSWIVFEGDISTVKNHILAKR